jgi:hypothetical protein
MAFCRSAAFSVALNILVFAAMLAAMAGLSHAQESPSKTPRAHEENPIASGMGRLYVFRPIRSFGAHIDDYVTVNGISVRRVSPGSGFYCDLSPGEYVISVAGHKTSPLKVSVVSSQASYICVMLHHQGGVSPRGGALTSDQSFIIRQFAPENGAQRAHQYPLTRENCMR